MQLLFVGLIGAFSLIGCSELSSPDDRDPSRVYTLPKWSVDAVTLTCTSGDCPPAVGAVIFVEPIADGFRLQRCTASLIAKDRMITNSHCGKGLSYSFAYLFLQKDRSTQRFAVGPRVFDREDPDASELEAGMGGDVAVFALNTPAASVPPLRLARAVPPEMSRLVAYLVNESSARFRDLRLDKETCATTPNQLFFRGGVEDFSVGLALFNCAVTHGNSGSPLFIPGERDEIQAVVNSSYPLQAQQSRPLVEKLGALFERRPDFLAQNFAMANRVHCMDIDGQVPAQKLCSRVSLAEQIRRPFETETARLTHERIFQMNVASPLAWTVRAFPIRVRSNYLDPYPKPGVVMIPVPQCVRSDFAANGEASQDVLYYSLAMDPKGNASGTVKKAEALRARFARLTSAPDYQVAFTRDLRNDFPDGLLGAPEDPEARRLLIRDSAVIERCPANGTFATDDKAVQFGSLL